MNAVTLLNMALHALLLSACGWAFVKWAVRDARNRAWTSLAMVAVSLVAPLLMESPQRVDLPSPPSPELNPAPSWKPDWKVTLAPVAHTELPGSDEEPAAPVLMWDIVAITRWMVMAWLAGSILLGLRQMSLCLVAWRWRRSLRALSEAERQGMKVTVPEALRVFDGEGCPCVAGILRPVIAVPASICSEWTARQWRWLLRHEGEHVRGHDTRIAWSLGWVKVALWWDPFIHALVEQWTQAREEICDGAAVTTDEDPAAYLGFLLDIAASTCPATPALLHMAASRPARRLRSRLTAMLARRIVRERVGAGFMAGVALAAVLAAQLVSCVGLEKPKEAPAEAALLALTLPQKNAKGAPHNAGEMMTRVFKVPPDFLSLGSEPQDPFSTELGTKTAPARLRMTAKEILAQRGVPFPDGASAVFNATTSQLIVKNTVVNLDRTETIVQDALDWREAARTQVHVTTKWVELPAKSNTDAQVGGAPDPSTEAISGLQDGSVLTDPQFQVIIRALSQKKGADLLSSPAITTRIGQRATVEVSREVFVKTKNAQTGKAEETPDFIGIRNDLLVRLKGGQLELQAEADIGDLEGGSNPASWKPGSKVITEAKVAHLRRSKTISLPDGHSFLLDMGDHPGRPGRRLLLFVTAKLIDRSGQRTSAEMVKKHAQSLEQLGKLREELERIERTEAGFTTQPAAGQGDTPADRYFLGWKEWKEGARLADDGDQEGARKKFQEAQRVIHAIAKEHPGWQSAVVAYRLRRIEEAIAALDSPMPATANTAAIEKNTVKTISITVKRADLRLDKGGDWLKIISDAIPKPEHTEPEKTEPAKDEVSLSPLQTSPGIYTLAGVLTSQQFGEVLRSLVKRKDVKVTSYPSMVTPSEKPATISSKVGTADKTQDGFSITVEPALGPDGYTVDLSITTTEWMHGVKRSGVTTSVTVWDAQTVVLGGATVAGEEGRLIFITAKMVK